jgi:DNA-binding SARP family transcriptional activator
VPVTAGVVARAASASGPEPAMRFTVLGPVRAWRGSAELDLGPRQQRVILAMLLVRAGQPVDVTELVDLLWPTDPPASAVNVIHHYVGGLRRLLEPSLPARTGGRWLLKHGAGYRLDVDPVNLDLLAARELAGSARQRAVDGDTRAGIDRYLQALELWTGWCGSGLDGVARIHPAFVIVDREGSTLARHAADLAVRGGRPDAVLPAVRRMTARDPLDEALQARLITCLAANGQQAEALATFSAVRRQLRAELGVDPCPELDDAHRRILTQQTGPATESTTSPTVYSVRPAQLPADLAAFSGRRAELATMDNFLPRSISGTAVVIALDGMPGVGKSALAVHWAHRAAPRFPDGQLFLNLRGFDDHGAPTTHSEALHTLLSGLGVPLDRIPDDVDARTGLYRSVLADRRVLVVLDNARTTEQVEALLPATAGSAAIVTSRNRLTGLAIAGAHAVTVELPPLDDSRASLRARLADGRVDAEPDAADAIIAACARLPLAVAVVAARAHDNPRYTLAGILAELRAAGGTLDAFTSADPRGDVRAVFSWSYRSLSPPAAWLLRLLSLSPSADISSAAAASLAGLSLRRVRQLATELTRSRLLGESRPGSYALHDLIHAFAAEQARDTDPDPDRQAAAARLVAHYQHTAYEVERWLTPGRVRGGPSEPAEGITAETIEDYEAAVQALARISVAVAHRVRGSVTKP